MFKKNNLSNSKIFFLCCLIFVAGIGMISFFPASAMRYKFWYFGAVMICALTIFLFWKNYKIRLTALVGLFLFLSFWRYAVVFPVNSVDKVWHYHNQSVTIFGMISKEPDRRSANQKLTVEVNKIKNMKVEGQVLVTTDLYPFYNYGDELQLVCDLQAPEEFDGFAYDRYLSRFDIYSVCYYPQIIKLKTSQGSRFYESMIELKNKARDFMNAGLGEPESGFAKAMLLGDSKDIPNDMRQVFSWSGLSHITSISGMHISILTAIMMAILLALGLSRRQAFYFAIAFLVFYILLIGAPASAVRSGVMGFLILLAMKEGRLSNMKNSLIFTAAVLLFLNPKLLRDDIGFQLSFLAVAGIAYIYPILNDWLDGKGIVKFRGVADVIAVTLVAQIFTLPILVLNFPQVSLIAPVSNLLVLWCLPFLLVWLLASLLLCMIIPAWAVVWFLPARICLDYIWKSSILTTKIPFAYVDVGWKVYVGLLVFYILVGYFLWKIRGKQQVTRNK